MKTTRYYTYVIFLIAATLFILFDITYAASGLEKVYSMRKVIHDAEWYSEQSALWKKEVTKNPENPDAWMNYYRATRYVVVFSSDRTIKNNPELLRIISEMEKSIPNTFECNYMKYYQNSVPKSLKYLEAAYRIQPDNPVTYYDFISMSEIQRKIEKKREYCRKLWDSEDNASSLMDYNYNMLNSTNENAILFTNGDNDTYPVWMLQDVLSIRTDVLVLNLSLAHDRVYLKQILKENKIKLTKNNYNKFSVEALVKIIQEQAPDRPIYFAVTVYDAYKKKLEGDLYNTGLVFKYSKERIDNVAYILRNFEDRYRLDYLEYNWYGDKRIENQSAMLRLNLNYIPALVQLYKHYKVSGDLGRANRCWNLGEKIAINSNSDELIDYLKQEK